MQNAVIAAVVYEHNVDQAIHALWTSVHALQSEGISVGGLLNKCTNKHYISEVVQSVSDSREYTILQCLGKASSACKLDHNALAESSIVLRDAIDNQVDVLFVNKFGVAESEGSGFIEEYMSAISANIIVISLVHAKYLEAWKSFTGDMGEIVPADEKALLDWIHTRLIHEDSK